MEGAWPAWLSGEPLPPLEAPLSSSSSASGARSRYQLPGDFDGAPAAQELLLMARAVWCARRTIHAEALTRSHWPGPRGAAARAAAARLPIALAAYRRATALGSLAEAAEDVRAVLSWYNHAVRLALASAEAWPRPELAALARRSFGRGGPAAALPPQTPCEFVEESLAWWAFGTFDRSAEWLGHGYFWRPCPSHQEGELPVIENAAGNAMNDFDVLEDRFHRLRKAKVLAADYALLRAHFPGLSGSSQSEVEEWLLANAAWISHGQVQRLRNGGDHHELLGVGERLAEFVDEASARAGLRLRSGGRAATFLVGDSYAVAPEGALEAEMLDVKGVGVHERADISSPKVTGFLCLADALRELGLQKLLQRLVELEGLEGSMGTVPFYALLDTGLTYCGTNPATGWEGERCVLLVRQRQSRLFDAYEGMNFSGVCPDAVHAEGPGRALRRLLHRWGLSAEFEPRALFHLHSDAAVSDACEREGLIADQSGTWNLQADATCSHFMDFSDYYALPRSPLPPAWRMSESALKSAFSLERTPTLRRALACPMLARRLWSCEAPAEAEAACEALRRELSGRKEIRDAAAVVNESGLIQPSKPKYCMCWFMELDDSEFACWCQSTAKAFHGGQTAAELGILEQIEAWLPTSPL